MPNTPTAAQTRPRAGRPAWYVTTAIPYVNAAPHIGFALELIQADVLARYRRSQGYAVRFQTGSDENSLKNVQAAEAAGRDLEAFVAENAGRFRALGPALDLSVDDFIRTSTEPRHRSGVERLWSACAASGDIYKKAYSGLYCLDCEQFYKLAELPDGLCPEHRVPLEEVSEENYFFRLSRYRDRLRDAIASGALKIEPAGRRNEVLGWLGAGLEDFSISRGAARARGWGIPVPGDPDQVVYVWFDALGNYVTALGYGDEGAAFRRFWCDAAAREHVIGKGITRFHAVYWPALLLSAGLPLPTRIFVHGYVTLEGRKIGKTAGNAVDPLPLAEAYGSDALRYYLLRHIRSTEDGDFNRERFRRAYESELAGQFGNLVHRTLRMIEAYLGGAVPAPAEGATEPGPLSRAARRLPETVGEDIERFAFSAALSSIWKAVALANKYVADCEPWSLAAQARAAEDETQALAAQTRLRHCLAELSTLLRVIGRCLAFFLPATSERLLEQIGADPERSSAIGEDRRDRVKIGRDVLLFPRI